MKPAKFATQIDPHVLKTLRSFAQQNDKNISSIVTEALKDYLKKYEIRLAFKQAMDNVIQENDELLKKLAK